MFSGGVRAFLCLAGLVAAPLAALFCVCGLHAGMDGAPPETGTSGMRREVSGGAAPGRSPFLPPKPELRLPERAATDAELREVVRLCGEAGSDSIPSLKRTALASPDPLVAGNAIRALGRLKAVSGDADLLALLGDDRPRVRQEVVLALGRSGDPASMDRLAPLLEGRDPALRPLVIQALGRLGGDRARRLLESVHRDPRATETDRAFARAALIAGT